MLVVPSWFVCRENTELTCQEQEEKALLKNRLRVGFKTISIMTYANKYPRFHGDMFFVEGKAKFFEKAQCTRAYMSTPACAGACFEKDFNAAFNKKDEVLRKF